MTGAPSGTARRARHETRPRRPALGSAPDRLTAPALRLLIGASVYREPAGRNALLFQIGDVRSKLVAGDSVVGPRGVPHAYAGADSKPARIFTAFSPAGKMETFFRETPTSNGPSSAAEFFRQHDMVLVGPSPLLS